MSLLNIVRPGEGEVLALGPISIRILEEGPRTDHRLGAVEVTVAPHTTGAPPHLHAAHDETFLVTAGNIRFTGGDESLDVSTGTFVVVPPGVPHTFSNPFDLPAVVIVTCTPNVQVPYLQALQQLQASEHEHANGNH